MKLKRLELTAEFADETRIHVVTRRAGYRAAHVQSNCAARQIEWSAQWNHGSNVPDLDALPPDVAQELVFCIDALDARMVQSGAMGSIVQGEPKCMEGCGHCLDCLTMKSALRIATAPYANDGFIRGMRDLADLPVKVCFDALLDPEKVAVLIAAAATARGVKMLFGEHIDDTSPDALFEQHPDAHWAIWHEESGVIISKREHFDSVVGLVHARERLAKLLDILPARARSAAQPDKQPSDDGQKERGRIVEMILRGDA